MKTITSLICAGLLSTALAACAAQPMGTQAQVQSAAPVLTGSFAGNYQSLSACVAQAWTRADADVWDVRQFIDSPNGTAVIQGNYRIFMFAYPFHATLRQEGDAVAVEFRQPPDSKETPDWVWQAVEDCAAQGV